MADKRSRKWIISWNNYPKELTLNDLKEKIINHAKVNYLILGFEKGEQEQTPHIQGYVNFKNPQYFTPIRNLLKNDDETYGYIEQAYGTDQQNKEYCTKQNNYIEYGECKENNDDEYNNLINDIINGMNYIELLKKYSSIIYRHYRDFNQLYKDIKTELREQEVIKYYNNKAIELIENENGEIK